MHLPSQSMAHEFPHDTISMFFFCVFLDGIGNISYPVAGNGLFNSLIQGFFGNTNELSDLFSGIADSECVSMIAMETVLINADIDRNDISLFQFIFIGEAMYHHVVYGNAGIERISFIVQERRDRFVVADKITDRFIE